VKVDWNNDNRWDECFGVAPDRAVYHAWPSSVGWDPMPNNGRADDVAGPFLYRGRYHTAAVLVIPQGYYCSSLIDNSWQMWGPCQPWGGVPD
jgi:hypothetical protein